MEAQEQDAEPETEEVADTAYQSCIMTFVFTWTLPSENGGAGELLGFKVRKWHGQTFACRT